MSAFQPFPKLSVDIREDGVARIVSSKGDDVLIVLEGDRAVLDRMVECWNALRSIYQPENHLAATEDYVKRLEVLRKEAWARVRELDPPAPTGEAA
jgi:hypothetical protein